MLNAWSTYQALAGGTTRTAWTNLKGEAIDERREEGRN
jgi:hypothetical protein